jgi:hypothetical protein
MSLYLAVLASWLLLHPGHSTRVELQWDANARCIELAMRIDHADLESALRRRLGRQVVIEDLTEKQAQQWIGRYLRETIRMDHEKLLPEQFRWVGWERKRVSSWVYAELTPVDHGGDRVELKVLSLLEVEPELNHVVTIRSGDRQDTVVLSMDKPAVVLRLKSEI